MPAMLKDNRVPSGNGAVVGAEKTKAQVVAISGFSLRGTNPLLATYETYREMRKQPTIALARMMAIAPVVAAEWSVEKRDDDVSDEWVQFIGEQLTPIREPLVQCSLEGGCDFGCAEFEKVFALVEGRVAIHKLKPLLPDLTEILVDKQTGAFEGYKQKDVSLPRENCLHIAFRVEGTQWYGQPLLENARETWNKWRKSEKGAELYDEKVAGSHVIVKYPPGYAEDASGTRTENWKLAQAFFDSLRASGFIAVPDVRAEGVPGTEAAAWDISILEDKGGRQPTFVERARYLDSLMVRALLLPERSVLEGEHGTLAEAETHADIAMVSAELTHRHVTRLVNWHLVDQLLVLNFGEEARGAVYLVASPLADKRLAFFREVYRAVLANPVGFLEEAAMIDSNALKDALGIPRREEPQPLEEPAPEGVDANDKRAATTRKVYADGESKQDEAASTD